MVEDFFTNFYTLPHNSGGVFCFTLRCLSDHLHHFWSITWVFICVIFKFCVHIVILNVWYGIVFGCFEFSHTSTLVGHLCCLPEKRRDDSKGQRRKRKMNGSEETEENSTLPLYPYLLQDSRPCPTESQYQLDAPVMQRTSPNLLLMGRIY